jgi:DNA repair protein RadC
MLVGVDICDPEEVAERARRVACDSGCQIVEMMLTARHAVIAYRILFAYRMTHWLVNPREIFRPAVALDASSIILAHARPGEARPSPEYREITTRIAKAGHILGIRLMDSLVVTPDSHYSFALQDPNRLAGIAVAIERGSRAAKRETGTRRS